MKKSSLKSIILVFAMCFFAGNIFAQGAYVNLNLGYGFGMGSMSTNNETYIQGSSLGHTSTYETVNLSYGKGLNVGGTFGYMFNKNVGAELGLSYLIGGKTTTTYQETRPNSSETETTDYSSSMIRINPTFVVTAGLDKINPYAKFGMIIGIGSVTYNDEDTQTQTIGSTTTSTVTVETIKLNGGLALGVNAGVGLLYGLSDKLSLFGELNMVNMSYAPTKGEVTEYTIDGASHLADLTTKNKEVNFVDSYTYDSTVDHPDATPSTSLKQRMPFGSFGVNFGVKFSF